METDVYGFAALAVRDPSSCSRVVMFQNRSECKQLHYCVEAALAVDR